MSEALSAYLDRVGLVGLDLPPTVETLRRIHRAHLDALPYENLQILLGRPPSVDPAACLRRVGDVGRVGYCFHQNGALELVLRELGFEVVRLHGHVWTAEERRADPELNHLALAVTGLPESANPDGRWWFDCGLGDCLREPLPVVVGVHEQGPFRYEITEVREDGWSFRHDPRGSFTGVEVTSSLPIAQTDVERAHVSLSTPPDGRFTRLLVVQRRTDSGAATFRSCLLTEVDGEGSTETELVRYDEWRSALVDGVGLPVDDIDGGELRGLFEGQLALHRAWVEAGRT